MIRHDKRYICRVCGFDCYPDMPWGENGQESSHDICPCCGIEFGYEDSGADRSHLGKIRAYWISKKNCSWFNPKAKPTNWDLPSQIRNLPSEYAGPGDEQLIQDYLIRNR